MRNFLWMVLWLMPALLPAQKSHDVTLRNDTDEAIFYLLFKPINSQARPVDVLGDEAMEKMVQLTVTLEGYDTCYFEIEALDNNEQFITGVSRINVCDRAQALLVVLSRSNETPRPAVEEEPQGAGSRLSDNDRIVLLNAHNQVRRDEGVPELAWSAEIAVYAQAWADQLAETVCTIEHRPRTGAWAQEYGENLYSMSSTGSLTGTISLAQGVRNWADEKAYFPGGVLKNFSAYAKPIGHYTQLIWATTERVGCAVSTCKSGQWNTLILVCNYDPPGNYIGEDPLNPKH